MTLKFFPVLSFVLCYNRMYVKWWITVVFWTVWPLIERRKVQLTLCCMFVQPWNRNTLVFSIYREKLAFHETAYTKVQSWTNVSRRENSNGIKTQKEVKSKENQWSDEQESKSKWTGEIMDVCVKDVCPWLYVCQWESEL